MYSQGSRGLSKAAVTLSNNCCSTSDQEQEDAPARHKKRHKAIPIRPLISNASRTSDSVQDSDRCRCPPGGCTCLGCADHPDNLPTMNLVRELWGHQLSENRKLDTALSPRAMSRDNPTLDFGPSGDHFYRSRNAIHSIDSTEGRYTSSIDTSNTFGISSSSTVSPSTGVSPIDGDLNITNAMIGPIKTENPREQPSLGFSEQASHSAMLNGSSCCQNSSSGGCSNAAGPQILPPHFDLSQQPPEVVYPSPTTEYPPFDFDYQIYTVYNGCVNEDCFCSVGCTCHGCCSHVGHNEHTAAANLLMEDSMGLISPDENASHPASYSTSPRIPPRRLDATGHISNEGTCVAQHSSLRTASLPHAPDVAAQTCDTSTNAPLHYSTQSRVSSLQPEPAPPCWVPLCAHVDPMTSATDYTDHGGIQPQSYISTTQA